MGISPLLELHHQAGMLCTNRKLASREHKTYGLSMLIEQSDTEKTDMNEETIVRKQKQQYMLSLEDRIAYSVLEASQLVGVSYTTLWRAIKRGDLHPIKGMGLMRISKKELQRFTEDTSEISSEPKRRN